MIERWNSNLLVRDNSATEIRKADLDLLNKINSVVEETQNISATKLTTPRSIAISGKVVGTPTFFDGSSNIIIPTTSAAILSSEVTDATSANTANMIVKRGASGEFSSGSITAGTALNNTTIEADGTLTFNGDAVVWDDWNSGFSTAKLPASNYPNWAAFVGGLYAYKFNVNDAVEMGAQEFTHSWKEGTPISIHIHWATNGTNVDARYVKWEVEYTWANKDGVFTSNAPVSFEETIPANTPSLTHLNTPVATFTPSGGKIGAYIICRVKRIAAAGTAPTNYPFGLALGIHFQIDTIGSRTIGNK